MSWAYLNFNAWVGEYTPLYRVEYNVNIPRYIALPIIIRTIICCWRMFQKAWLPGWGAIVPFYNIYLRFKMAGMWGWWVLSLLFPPLFLIVLIVSFFKICLQVQLCLCIKIHLAFLSAFAKDHAFSGFKIYVSYIKIYKFTYSYTSRIK